MKTRLLLIFAALLVSLNLKSQPSEVTHLGTIVVDGASYDDSFGPYNIGFNFNFFGTNYSQFYVNTNGMVLFGEGSFNPTSVSIPNASLPNNFIAPLWDNLLVDASSGKILYKMIGASPTRKLVIQFLNMGFTPFPAFMGTFSVVLYETTNVIQVQYRIIIDDVSIRAHGSNATIGIENASGTAGVQYSYHNPSAISGEQAISFTPSGPTYTMNPNALYEGIYLTENSTLPEPGITQLLSPAQNAVVGIEQTFVWSAVSNAESYLFLLSNSSDLSDATAFNAGTNLSYTVTGLTLNETYYWSVFPRNATGTTWCKIKRFTTSSVPQLAAVPQTVYTEVGQDRTIKLNYTGGDASPKTAIITSLPGQGQLYQYNAGAKGDLITTVPMAATDAGRNVIYTAPVTTGNGIGNFNFKMHDNTGDSPESTVTVNVNPAGVPNYVFAAQSTIIEIQFDRMMNNPAGKENQFTVTINGSPATITSASLKPGDPYTIILTTSTPLTGSEVLLVAYTQGDVSATTGGLLESFTAQPVLLEAQILTFTTSLNRKYGDTPFELSATSSSGLASFTFASSNLAVATISESILTIKTIGTSEITAFQAGNDTIAPARYIRTLTVGKGDQTITFGTLPGKITTDVDFTLNATATSGLTVTYTSTNTAVATVAGNTVHITGAGSTVITASQPGSSLWNAAPDVPQTLIVTFPVGIENPLIPTRSFNIYSVDNFIYIRTLDDEWDGKTGSLKIVDLAGKTISTLKDVQFTRNSLVQIHANEGQGLYIVEIRNGIKRFTSKVVVR